MTELDFHGKTHLGVGVDPSVNILTPGRVSPPGLEEIKQEAEVEDYDDVVAMISRKQDDTSRN